MKSKPCLTLEDVRRMAQAAEREAVQHGWAVTIAIVDDGGHLLWLQRLDGAAPISAAIAPATMPGATTFTVTPRDATSKASDLEAPCRPALAAA